LESNKDNPERVQTQMYVATNCSRFEFLCEPFLPLLLRNYPNLKGRKSVALGAISETSDLIPSGK
jgi:hypothetical protein